MVSNKYLRFGMRLGQGVSREGPARFATFMRYFRAELAPPKMEDMPAIKQGFANLQKAFYEQRWKQMTTRQAWLNTCVGVEVMCWFFVGECIGRWNFIGYVIPATVVHPED